MKKKEKKKKMALFRTEQRLYINRLPNDAGF